jgi:hypothetical protein
MDRKKEGAKEHLGDILYKHSTIRLISAFNNYNDCDLRSKEISMWRKPCRELSTTDLVPHKRYFHYPEYAIC